MKEYLLWAITLLFSLQVSGHVHRFGYAPKEQKVWSEHSQSCAGKYQSPIHIVSHKAQRLPMPALEMVGYHNLLPKPISVKNTGHSVSLSPDSTTINHPKVFGALLPSEYIFESLHFHWGHRNARGSEHVMNGIRFPIEMHLVHRNLKYDSLATAMQKSDGLVVLAYFFQVREKANPSLQAILRSFSEVIHPGSSTHLTSTFTLSSLLTSDTDVFYTYRGSLTTPPCSEAVTWIVFPDPLPISFNQIRKFRKLYSGHEKMVDNYRMPQPLNSRNVFVRRIWKDEISAQNLTKFDSVSWLN